VPIKSVESQAELMLLGVRDLLIKQRTAVINTIRGYAAEFGVIAAKGPVKVAELLQQAHAEEVSAPVGAGHAQAARRSARGTLVGEVQGHDRKWSSASW
jgi:transposase